LLRWRPDAIRTLWVNPGGACWDDASCTGQRGIRGAASVDGLPDDHDTLAVHLAVPEPLRQPGLPLRTPPAIDRRTRVGVA
jgi:hypothetical protein